jgi:hypothetical protein
MNEINTFDIAKREKTIKTEHICSREMVYCSAAQETGSEQTQIHEVTECLGSFLACVEEERIS